jgi:hypothetical protein
MFLLFLIILIKYIPFSYETLILRVGGGDPARFAAVLPPPAFERGVNLLWGEVQSH